jgi:hypothetical protein
MDNKILIKNVNSAFCQINKMAGRQYLEAWLSDVDFGGLYHSDQYVLDVKAAHRIDGCRDEIRYILTNLDLTCYEELKQIWSVAVYDERDSIHCMSSDLLVFDQEAAC